MQTFLTPEPVICEIRNAAGEISIELADVSTTTVEITITAENTLGFLDDMRKAVNRWGSKDFGNADADPTEMVKVEFRPESVAAESGSTESSPPESGSTETGSTESTQTESTQTESGSGKPRSSASEVTRGVLIVDTEPACGLLRTAFSVRITAPTGSSVRTRTESGDTSVSGTADRIEVRTASGSVQVNEVSGSAFVKTASGDVTLPKVGGDLDVQGVSGKVAVGSIQGRAHLVSTSGDIAIDCAAGDVEVRTVSGEIEVGDVQTGRTELIAVSGGVTVGVHPGSVAAIELISTSGRATTDFEVVEKLEGATLSIRAKTVSGDISLRSAVPAA